MKFIIASVLLSAFASSALAEVKPPKAVVAHFCGNPNRSEQICIGSTVDRESMYIIKRVMNGEPVYMRAETKALNPGPLPGSSRVVYRATAVEQAEQGYRVENRYELMFSTVNNPGTGHAEMRVNGSSDVTGYNGFRMEAVFHTQ